MPGKGRRGLSALAFLLVGGMVLAVAQGPASAAPKEQPGRWKAAVLYDPQSGRFLREYQADKQLPPASLTKMVTALLVAERMRPGDQVRISKRAAEVPVDSIRWPAGKRFTADDLLHAMMMRSSNGAAIALAEAVGGSVSNFVALMNARATEAGARDSRFRNPHGLDAKGQRATARDLALIATAVLQDPWLSEVVQRRVHRIPWSDGGGLMVYNSNRLMSRYRGAIGVKPGFTSQAGNSLAGAALRRGRAMVVVVLNDPAVYEDATMLLDTGFRIAPEGPAWIPPQPVEDWAATATTDVTAPPLEEASVLGDPIAEDTAIEAEVPVAGRGGRFLYHAFAWSVGWVALNSLLAWPKRRRRRDRRAGILVEHAIEHAEQTLYADTQMIEPEPVARAAND